MSVKYSRVATTDPDSTTIDFSSIFSYEYPKYFSHSTKPGLANQFKSMFTYSGGNPNSNIPAETQLPPSRLVTFCSVLVTLLCYILVGLTLPISAWFTFRTIPQHERLIVFRLGRLLATKGPGLVVLLPCIDKCHSVDLRTKAFSVPPIMVNTADGATIEVGADIYFHIFDAMMSITKVHDQNHATRVISQTLLQRQLGRYNLSDLEMNRTNIVDDLQIEINSMTKTWGLKLERIEMSQVRVLAQPNPLIAEASNPLSFLGPMLFPPGTANPPIEALQEKFLQFCTQQSKGSSGKLVPPESIELGPQGASLQDGGPSVMLETEPEDFVIETPADLMRLVRPHLGAALVADFNCVYTFFVQSSNSEEVFYLDLKTGEGAVDSGELPDDVTSDVTLTLSLEDFRNLIGGQLSALGAYMTGRLSVKGDLGAAKRLTQLVDHIRQQHPM